MSIYYHVTLVIMLVKADVQLMPGQQWKYYEYFPQAINQNEERKKKRMKKFYFICYQMDRFGMAGIASNFAARLLLQLISPRSSNTPTMEKVTAAVESCKKGHQTEDVTCHLAQKNSTIFFGCMSQFRSCFGSSTRSSS